MIENLIDQFYLTPDSMMMTESEITEVDTLILVAPTEQLATGIGIFEKLFSKYAHVNYQIIPFDAEKMTFRTLNSLYRFSNLICCGLSFQDIGIQANTIYHHPFNLNHKKVLLTKSPAQLESADKQFKSEFWVAFQTLYDYGNA